MCPAHRTADAAPLYYGDSIHSTVTFSNDDGCLGYTIWKEDGSKFTGYNCRGVIEVDQRADKGDWIGIEPTATAGTAVFCHTYNNRSGQSYVSKSKYWDSDYVGAGAGSFGYTPPPPQPICMINIT